MVIKMTEKRFTLAYEKGNWWAVRDGDITLWKEEVVGLLNQLNDENEQLKKVMNELKDMLQRDIDTGVRSYPLKLSEYLVSALEKIGDYE